ncbi:unnamed protein product, partial [Musa acuminata subsp. burmannicoides]
SIDWTVHHGRSRLAPRHLPWIPRTLDVPLEIQGYPCYIISPTLRTSYIMYAYADTLGGVEQRRGRTVLTTGGDCG